MNISDAKFELGLDIDCGDKEIIDAFRKLAKQAHPDLNGGTDALLRRLIIARDLLLRSKEGASRRIDHYNEPVKNGTAVLTITLDQALNGGEIIYKSRNQINVLHGFNAIDHANVSPINHTKSIRIALPKGLRHDEKLRLKSADSEAVFHIQILTKGQTRVVDDDIWMSATIDAKLFHYGGTAVIDTPSGPQKIEITRSLSVGSCVCLKGLGLPATQKHPKGNLHIRLDSTLEVMRPASDLLSEFSLRWA